MPQTIDENEARQQIAYIQQALGASTQEERNAALAGGLLNFGPRFLSSLSYLAEESDGDAGWTALLDETVQLFGAWLNGQRLSDRADEDVRRARAGAMALEQSDDAAFFREKAALAQLALPERHPERNVEQASEALFAALADARADGDVDAEIRVAGELIDHGLEPPEGWDELIAPALALEGAEEDTRRTFLSSLFLFHIGRAIEARDEGRIDDQRRESEKALKLNRGLAATTTDGNARLGLQLQEALALEVGDDVAAAAATYAEVADAADPAGRTWLQAALHESRLRLVTRTAYPRAARLLEQVVPRVERRYLNAVSESEMLDAGSQFQKAVTNYAFALAHLDRWDDALRALDRGKSRWIRQRAALRAGAAGRRLLELERSLHAIERGVPGAQPEQAGDPDARADMVGSDAHDALLEEYRSLRVELPAEPSPSPGVTDLASLLRGDEAVAVLGIGAGGTIVALVTAGDREAPTYAEVIEDWDSERWMSLFADGDRGWALGLARARAGAELGEELDRLLISVDEPIGSRLARALDGRGIRRLTVVPHRMLHLIPFWALPSLDGFDVSIEPSAWHAAAAAEATEAHRLASALAVTNPTLDLPLSVAEAASIRRHLGKRGVTVAEVGGAGAVEDEVCRRLEGQSLFHFSGHATSDPLAPTRAALLVQPAPAQVAGGDPFPAWFERVDDWTLLDDGRTAEVPGLGRLSEEIDDELGLVERRLEYAPTGTLSAQYRNGGPARLAERWSAGDIAVGEEFATCGLAVLSACESGAGGLAIEIDEHGGLPAALALAGVSTVVGTLWPVAVTTTIAYFDLFYQELAARRGTADVADIVRSAARRLRALSREEAASLLGELREELDDPGVRFRLETEARRIAGNVEWPFAHPVDWAAFYVVGSGLVTLTEEVPG